MNILVIASRDKNYRVFLYSNDVKLFLYRFTKKRNESSLGMK